MYKVVTKIIVGRIRPLLSGLVSTLQIAFVLGRKGVDIAIIAQELIHFMSKKKDRVGVMAIKIDLEKAYDCIEWSFIRDTLALFKFPKHLISLIMNCVSSQSNFFLFNRGALISLIINCVSSSSISILFNGGALKPFLPSRGIRQGDPLSPYLFILCMEILVSLITEKCKANLWDPITAFRWGIAFSHLFFADDLMLFAKADRKNCMAVRDALDTFCALLGQKINKEKSRVFFSPNVSQHCRDELCEILEFRSIPSLGKYLGFPIKHTSIP